jgi:F0F1-type ATP synthase membrane subunit c/vacuolar-type H+-ATPase subunit K
MTTGLPVSLIVEMTLLGLLAATIFFCARLEKRIRSLRADQAGLGATIAALNSAIGAAQASLAGLKSVAREADEKLARNVGQARALADELALLSSAGERIASRFEAARAAMPQRKGTGAGETLHAVR